MIVTNSDVIVRVAMTKDCVVPQRNLARFMAEIQQPGKGWMLDRYGIGNANFVVNAEQIGAFGDLDETYQEYFVG